MAYRLLGHERIALTRQEIERMVQQGLLALDTKVIHDGELRGRTEVVESEARARSAPP